MGLFSEFFSFAAHAEDVDCRFAWDNGHITSNSPSLVIFPSVVYFLKFHKYPLLEKETLQSDQFSYPRCLFHTSRVYFTGLIYEAAGRYWLTDTTQKEGSIAWSRNKLIGGTSWSIQIFKHTCLSHFFSFSRSHQKWLNALAHKFDPTSNKLRLHVKCVILKRDIWLQ